MKPLEYGTSCITVSSSAYKTSSIPLKASSFLPCVPSVDKDTHGFDGQKNVHTSSKTLEIHEVFPAAFSSSDRFSASSKLLAPDSDGFSSDFWLLRRRCVVTHQDEKGKKRRKDAPSGVGALVNRGYLAHEYLKRSHGRK